MDGEHVVSSVPHLRDPPFLEMWQEHSVKDQNQFPYILPLARRHWPAALSPPSVTLAGLDLSQEHEGLGLFIVKSSLIGVAQSHFHL